MELQTRKESNKEAKAFRPYTLATVRESVAKFTLGDKVYARPYHSTGSYNGIVTYIHPDGNFITVDLGVYAESFHPSQLGEGWRGDTSLWQQFKDQASSCHYKTR